MRSYEKAMKKYSNSNAKGMKRKEHRFTSNEKQRHAVNKAMKQQCEARNGYEMQ